ncbi:MAG: methylated-DNA--[protein]-cysteine S-methyltransferase [Gaiellaceae bacterium]
MQMIPYEAAGWGVGELIFEDGLLAWHELPRPREDAAVHPDHPLAERLRAYFGGKRDAFSDVEVDLSWCTSFQRAVVGAMRSIPYGETATYGEVAALSGHPNAQRAVGTVCAHNRYPLLIPCHRVVAAEGLGSYGSFGREYKQRLLELEGVLL